MAKKFFYKGADGIWLYGTFQEDGTTVKTELTASPGLYRRRWETINSVDYLSILNANNLGEIIQSTPISEIASDSIGTAYASKAAFNTATKDFFFNVATANGFISFPSGDGYMIRFGYRNGWVVDKTLTATGFAGTENTDWEQIGGQTL